MKLVNLFAQRKKVREKKEIVYFCNRVQHKKTKEKAELRFVLCSVPTKECHVLQFIFSLEKVKMQGGQLFVARSKTYWSDTAEGVYAYEHMTFEPARDITSQFVQGRFFLNLTHFHTEK